MVDFLNKFSLINGCKKKKKKAILAAVKLNGKRHIGVNYLSISPPNYYKRVLAD